MVLQGHTRSRVLSCFFFDVPSAPLVLHSFLHDALPISRRHGCDSGWRTRYSGAATVTGATRSGATADRVAPVTVADRKSTRLNSSHRCISYAVFCLKKKKHPNHTTQWSCQTTTAVKLHS